jgi:hypothetical protein
VSRNDRRPDAEAAFFNERLPSSRLVLSVLVWALLISLVVVARANVHRVVAEARAVTGAVASMAPSDVTTAAADALEQAASLGGTGITFEIVQTTTIAKRDDGEAIELADPADPKKVIEVDSVPSGSYIERGTWTSAGFHSEIRRGPDDPAEKIDWDATPTELSALVREGVTYRNDGEGWYETDRPPGIGLDPASIAKLPTLLRELAATKDSAVRDGSPDDPFADVTSARQLQGDTKVADAPGIIAVDLAAATELREPADMAFDDKGRLVGLRILARNTNLDRYDLLVETVITFAYPDAVPELPKPEPHWVEPTPEPES